jgi:hypothetical protein
MASRTVKVLATVVAIGLLIAVGVLAATWVWLQQNADRLKVVEQEAMREGAHLGSGEHASVCEAEALRRLPTLDGVLDEARNKRFLTACLKVAKIDDAYCEGVPPRDQVMASARWAVARCEKAGRGGDASCTRLVGAIQERCLKQRS